MEEKDILEILITKLNNEDIWFTTKQDPTFHDADFYYELDEYGDLTDKAQEKVIKDITKYIGDGAIYLEDAIELWIQESLMNCSIAYTDMIKTHFKPKQVVDQIEAFENPKLEENKDIISESEFANEDLLNDFTQYVANNAKELKNGTYEVSVPSSLGYDKILTKDMLKKAYMKVKSLLRSPNGDTSIVFENKELETESDSGILTPIPKELLEPSKPKKWTQEMWNQYYNRCKEDYIDAYLNGDDNVISFLNMKAKQLGLEDVNITEDTWEEDIDKIATAYADMKEKKYKELNENVKVRLEEENTKSAELISSMFTAKDFDSDSPQGQIVMRTSELFNALSDLGYDVQVSFDNGESQSTILLGKQGGRVIITITNNNTPLRAFANGSFELTDDNLDILKDIQEQISSI